METYIAMLRGINVSGQKMIRMTDLQALLSEPELKNIRTYIQSGNVVFEHSETDRKKLAELIRQKIRQQYDFDVPVIIRNRRELLELTGLNPFLNLKNDTGKLYVTFLEDEPSAENIQKAHEKSSGTDQFRIVGKQVFLFCPDGYGNTKLNNSFFEKIFKTTATTRNWKTVEKLSVI